MRCSSIERRHLELPRNDRRRRRRDTLAFRGNALVTVLSYRARVSKLSLLEVVSNNFTNIFTRAIYVTFDFRDKRAPRVSRCNSRSTLALEIYERIKNVRARQVGTRLYPDRFRDRT